MAPTRKPSPSALSRDRGSHVRVGPSRVAAEQNAELVPSEAECAADAGHGRAQVMPEVREHRVARQMPELVVVQLEAVEIEHQQHRWLRFGSGGQRSLKLAEHLLAVAETGDVGDGLVL